MPDDLVVRHGESLPSGLAATTPEARAMRTYLQELFAFHGVHSVGYNRLTAPGELRVTFTDFDFAKLADNTLRDSLLGVRIVFAGVDRVPFDMAREGAAWTSNPSNSARAIAAMPGVVSHMNLGSGTIEFRTEAASVRDKLKTLVNDRFNGYQAVWTVRQPRP